MSSAMKSGISASRRIVSAFGSARAERRPRGRHAVKDNFRRGQRRKCKRPPPGGGADSVGPRSRPWDRLVPICSDFVTDTFALSDYDRIGEEAGRTGLNALRGEALDDPRLRQRAQPRLPARPPRPHRGRRLLGLARRDARPRRPTEPPTGSAPTTSRSTARCGRRATQQSASSTTSAEQALAGRPAADAAGITFVLLYVAYARGGLDRFRQPSAAEYLNQVERLRERGIQVGLAPHSVRACPPDWLEEIGRYAGEHALPFHVHADEQPREVDECLEHGIRPIELLARTGCLGPRTTVVHATHANDLELDLIAEAGARICACLTTEANLGDGFSRWNASASEASGSASAPTRTSGSTHWRSSASSRAARRRTLRRNVISPRHSALLRLRRGRCGARNRRLGRGRGRPGASVARRDRRVDAFEALVFGCSADVFV